MNAPSWDRVKELFQDALERPAAERAVWLRERCGGDRALFAEVESLLADHERAGSFAEQPVADVLRALGADSHTVRALQAGDRLSVYDIQALLGAGGMGEVYKARDTRLARIVAIKVLPSHLAADGNRYRRFEREARAVASLDHPHIGALYDIGEHDGRHFLVMQYLEGETLAARLAKGALPLEQALRYAIDVADALDHAHRRGIVHRDLKPANIVLTKSGATLLDFGLAKWRASVVAGAGAPAFVVSSDSLTDPALIAGTLHYMAPEQVEGKDVDARTDIFAFGAVLYEMITGTKAFGGDSTARVMAAILGAQPPSIATLRPLAPAAISHLVEASLAKDPDGRWQSAGDVARQLHWIQATRGDAAAEAKSGRSWADRNRRTLAVAATLASAAGLVAAMSIRNGMSGKSAPVTRSVVSMPGGALFGDLALSPDGTHLAYTSWDGASNRIYLHALDQFEPRLIDGTREPQVVFFSADSQWLGFFDSGKLKKVAVTGGAPQTICDTPALGGAAWGQDDTIVFSPSLRDGLLRVPASGGTPQVLTSPRPGERSHRLPQFLPGGKSVLFTIVDSNLRSFDEAKIAIASVDTGRIKLLPELGSNPRFLPTGHLLYLRGTSLVAAPFDARREQVTGRSAAIIDHVSSYLDGGSVIADVDEHGLLAYARGTVVGTNNRVVWVDRNGRIEPLIDALGGYDGVSLSPDGQTLAIAIRAANDQIWLYDLQRRTMSQLTFEWDNIGPIWTPDGKRIAFESDRDGPNNFYWRNRDGSGSIERLTVSPNRHGLGSWLPDGKGFAYVDSYLTTDSDIWLLSLGSARRARPLIQAPFNQSFATFSPDGRWLAYVSDETGQPEVFVQPYPSLDAKWHISSGGGTRPKWGKHELYYRHEGDVMSVPFETQPTFVPGAPRKLFSGDFYPNYDVAPDGRFIMIQVAQDVRPSTREITLVHNWFEEVKRRTPTSLSR